MKISQKRRITKKCCLGSFLLKVVFLASFMDMLQQDDEWSDDMSQQFCRFFMKHVNINKLAILTEDISLFYCRFYLRMKSIFSFFKWG